MTFKNQIRDFYPVEYGRYIIRLVDGHELPVIGFALVRHGDIDSIEPVAILGGEVADGYEIRSSVQEGMLTVCDPSVESKMTPSWYSD